MAAAFSSISSLPDELLLTITERAVFEAVSTEHKTCSNCAVIPNNTIVKALSLVSRRFRRIVRPYLFHTPLSKRGSKHDLPGNDLVKLREVLRLQSEMVSSINVLNISAASNSTSDNVEAAEYIISQLSRPCCLILDLNDISSPTEDYPFPERVNLITTIKREATGVTHIDIAGSLSSLARLRNCRWRSLARLDLRDIQVLLPKKNVVMETGSTCFTALSLRDCTVSAKTIESLIHWTSKLEHFSFTKSESCPEMVWHPRFEDVLVHHFSTLRTLELCSAETGFQDDDDSIFDTSRFPILTHLRLSAWQTMPRTQQQQHTDFTKLLSGPRLTHFTWDFSAYKSSSPDPDPNTTQARTEDEHQNRESFFHFGAPEESCLHNLATTATSHSTALQTIHIVYNPSPSSDGRSGPNPWNCYNMFSAWYPWERMERVRDEVLRPGGRELTWDAPPFKSKEEWQKDFVADVRRRENEVRRGIERAMIEERVTRGRGGR